MVGKPKGQRGQVTCPWPHSEQPQTEGKGHLPLAVELSSLWQPELAALPGPRSCVCKLRCPARLSPGPGKERRPAEPSPPPSVPASRPSPPGMPRPTGGSPRRPGCPATERVHTSLPSLGKLLRQRPLPFWGVCSSSVCCVRSPSSSGGSRTSPPNSGAPRGPCRRGPAALSAPACQGCRRDPETEPESAALSWSPASARRKHPKSRASAKPVGFAVPPLEAGDQNLCK